MLCFACKTTKLNTSVYNLRKHLCSNCSSSKAHVQYKSSFLKPASCSRRARVCIGDLTMSWDEQWALYGALSLQHTMWGLKHKSYRSLCLLCTCHRRLCRGVHTIACHSTVSTLHRVAVTALMSVSAITSSRYIYISGCA